VSSLKYNSSTSEYYVVSYNSDTNTETGIYDLLQIAPGTLITNSVTGKKFLVLYDNIKNKNSIKPIN